MRPTRLRTKFLLSMILVTVGLTGTTLLVVRQGVRENVRREVVHSVQNSATTFQTFEQQRHATLQHSASLLADLPNLRALMTTHDPRTIQDASGDLWRLAGSDLLVLADPSGRVLALQATAPEYSAALAEASFRKALSGDRSRQWWFGGGHLYEVFVQPIYFGRTDSNQVLGYAALGYEMDDRITQDVARVASSQVAFRYGHQILRSTLPPSQQKQLAALESGKSIADAGSHTPVEIQLGKESFLETTVNLEAGADPSLRLSVLKSLDEATAFLHDLNRLLLGLGLAAALVGSALVWALSYTFTRPLDNLVAGVRALGHGDYRFQLDGRGGYEVAEVSRAFDRMRQDLRRAQGEVIESERLATIGRMASSISHDLRHSLAAIYANAEFLSESSLTPFQRQELYAEVRVAVHQMTDLIESLLEFSRTRESLRPQFADLKESVDNAIQLVRTHPDYHSIEIEVRSQGTSQCWFDPKKIERVLHNLLLNACEAVPKGAGKILVTLTSTAVGMDIRVSDNGGGIAALVREHLFDPFVSHGKENGTGMGLTVVQKIMHDHRGDVVVESTSTSGTIFRLHLPLEPTADFNKNEG